MTPQINRLGKTSPVLRVSTDIYGVSKEIDGKTFIFSVNLGPKAQAIAAIYAKT